MRRRFVSLPLVVVGFLLYQAVLLSWFRKSPQSFRPRAVTGFRNPIAATQNATLGFEKVFAIGFSSRTDKRDALTMVASFVGLDIDWFEGVALKSMPEKAWPATWEPDRERPIELACWRAHMNVLQQIVSRRISSALILEDDADWDITLKAQMLEFARGARAIQQRKWHRAEGRFFIIPNDTTVPPTSHRADFFHPDLVDYGNMQQSRIVFDAVDGSCTAGYAVTYDGARKILAQLSMLPLNQPVDMAYAEMCGHESSEYNFRCIAPYPSLISSWRQTGYSARDSDIYESGNDWHEAYSNAIVYSTMLNAHRLANGEKTCLAQWEDVQRQEIDPSEWVSPRGFLSEHEPLEFKGAISSSDVFVSADSEEGLYVHSSNGYGHIVASDYMK